MEFIAFAGANVIAAGELPEVVRRAKAALDGGEAQNILIFDGEESRVVEVDFRGDAAEVLERVAEKPRGPGRPKLGVVAREVTLLPRHWDWLQSQPGGASVALRKLVEEARRDTEGRDRVRRAQESTYRFIAAMAGNEPGFEEANRALFARERARFAEQTEKWPEGVRDHARKLAEGAFAE